MRNFYSDIIKKRKAVVIVFFIVFAVSLVCSRMVAVNYDMADYLPADTKSTMSLDVMKQEFGGRIPNARVMIKDVTVPQALEYKEKLKAVEGVSEVTWLDDAADVTVALSSLDADTVKEYYTDNAALFTVTIDEDYRISAVSEIRSIIGENGSMTGSAVSTADATLNTVSEIMKITVIAVAFVLLVLLLTTTSWLEPLIILVGLGVAIMLNNGSNLVFGEISFVTNAAGSVLQLAVSLDYSVFLLHRFEECRKENPDPKAAMTDEQKQQIIAAAVASLTDEQKSQIKAGAVASLTDEQKAEIKNAYIEKLMKSKDVTDQITAAVKAADKAAGSVAELKGQLDNYSVFYKGLKSYTSAVSGAADGAKTLKLNMNSLYKNVGVLKGSVGKLNNGAKTLYKGTANLLDGTNEFANRTANIKSDVNDEIDSMLSSITGSGKKPESFVSDKNTNVESVQFVIKTKAIKIPEDTSADNNTGTEEKTELLAKAVKAVRVLTCAK